MAAHAAESPQQQRTPEVWLATWARDQTVNPSELARSSIMLKLRGESQV
jgi:hypothetical protein